MTARQYLEIFLFRWRILVSGLVLGLAVGFGVTWYTPTTYEADVTILVAVRQTPGDTPTELSQQRLSTYVALLTSNKLLSEVADRLRPSVSPSELAGKIRGEVKPETVLLEVIASDTSQDRAVEIANLVARQFVTNVAQIERPPGYDQPLVTGQVYESETPSVSAVSPKPMFNFAVGAGLGLLIGAGLALWRNAADTRIRTGKRLREILQSAGGVPLLGAVDPSADLPKRDLADQARKSTAVVDAYRTLRTYLRFGSGHGETQVLVVAGVAPDCDAAGTAGNLAVVIGAAGRRVLIIDADLRRPAVADFFGLGAGAGLTDLLTGTIKPAQATRWVGHNVAVMTCGAEAPGPGELLSSPRLPALLQRLRTSHDVVVVVGPPLSAVPDALALVAHVDGVMLVVRQGRSTTTQVKAAIAALDTISARCVGSVLTPSKLRRRRRPAEAPRPVEQQPVEAADVTVSLPGARRPAVAEPVRAPVTPPGPPPARVRHLPADPADLTAPVDLRTLARPDVEPEPIAGPVVEPVVEPEPTVVLSTVAMEPAVEGAADEGAADEAEVDLDEATDAEVRAEAEPIEAVPSEAAEPDAAESDTTESDTTASDTTASDTEPETEVVPTTVAKVVEPVAEPHVDEPPADRAPTVPVPRDLAVAARSLNGSASNGSGNGSGAVALAQQEEPDADDEPATAERGEPANKRFTPSPRPRATGNDRA